MKRKTLTAPANATREEKAAWEIYPDHQLGAMVQPQSHHRERIIRLASGGYGAVEILSRRQKNEIKQFNDILATIP